MFYKRQKLTVICGRLGSFPFLVGSVLQICLLFCVVCFLLACLRPVSCPHNNVSLSGLSILDCPCRFLYRLLTSYKKVSMFYIAHGSSWSWSYGSWIYNYLCNHFLSALTLWLWMPLRRGVLLTTFSDKVFQWLTAGQWFFPGTPVSSTNKTDRQDLGEILLIVALSTINQPNNQPT